MSSSLRTSAPWSSWPRQLVAWGLAPERDGPLTVRNEAGDILDPAATIAEAGLGNGDIFKVERR